jgi:peroxiredoxin
VRTPDPLTEGLADQLGDQLADPVLDPVVEPGIAVGSIAPDFELRDQFGQDVRLSSFRDRKAVALVFYPFAFSGVCTSEMSGIKARLESFLTFDSEVLAISCDPVYSLRAFADADGLNFPLLSDYWPHGAVTRSYQVFDEARGCPQRSSYVIDRDGVVRWSVHHASPFGRDLDEHVRVLQGLL